MYRRAKTLPRPVKELMMGAALSGAILWNGLRGGSKSPAVNSATIALWYEVLTHLGGQRAKRKFAVLQGKTKLKLHLGSGPDIRLGWVNIDAFTILPPVPTNAPDTYVLQYDLRQPLPIADGSVSQVYSSHFWEHLPAADGHRLFQECYRLLSPNGIFRIALPDLEAVFKAYLGNDEQYFTELREANIMTTSDPGMSEPSIEDCLNFSIYQYGEHKCIYNPDRLAAQLTRIGFSSAHPVMFDPSIDVDTALRRKYSFYVEATK